MKLRLLMVVASALLLLAPNTASAVQQDDQPGAATSGRAQMEQNANESEQATTDMSYSEPGQGTQAVQNVSYGGVAAGQSESGSRHYQPCNSGPQCKVYFGQ
jgi:hypothetical protein